MKKSILLLLFSCFSIYCNKQNDDVSEFIIKKKTPNVSASRLRESIIKKSGSILKTNINLDKNSIDLREFLLSEIELYLDQDENSFLICANKNQLQESLDELIDLKRFIDKNLFELEKKVKKLKDKFRFHSKIKDINGKF